MSVPDITLFFKRIINSYVNAYNLNYSLEVDPGLKVYRHITESNINGSLLIDIDLRIKNGKLLLQFFSSNLIYVFEWTRSKEEFLQIMRSADRDAERSIHSFMDANVLDRGKHFGLKYGLR